MQLIVRPPGDAFGQALSEHPGRGAIDVARARAQHAAFVAALREGGLDVVGLPAEPGFPDACFTSDALLTLPPAARPGAPSALLFATRPGAESRRGEVGSVLAAARDLRPEARVVEARAPGTIDAGDVIVYGDRVAIGVSARTDEDGATQLAEAARSLGYRTYLCPVRDRLHLASAVTVLRPGRLIGTAAGFASLDETGAGTAPRDQVERLVVADEEVAGANVLAVGGRCLMAAGNPGAAALMRAAGETVVELDLSEFTLADGGPTCLVAHVW